jgi:hypothetical protein
MAENPMAAIYARCGIKVIGIVKAINEFVSKKDSSISYWSVDIDTGHKINVNVRLDPKFDRSSLQLYEVASIPCSISVYNNQMSLNAVV